MAEKGYLPAEGPGSFSFWLKEAKRSEDWLKSIATKREWDKNTQAYLTLTERRGDDVVVPKDYANVEQKKALLFFQVPEVTLTAEQPGLEDAVRVFQAVLNRKLRADEVNAGAMMDEVLFDVLCPAGIGFSKIGYEAEQDGMTTIQQPAMDPAGQPIVDPMTQQPVTMPVEMPNIVRERYFWNRIPVKAALIPADFHGSDFDQAPWLGWTFTDDLALVAKRYDLDPDELKPSKASEDARIKVDIGPEDLSGQRVRGCEIWYKTALYHEDVVNGDLYSQLVWFEGMEQPVVARPSPYQRVEGGRLVGGMKGNPIHVLTLRYVSDQAIPPSDAFVSRDLVDELSRGRTDMITQRKRTAPINGYDPARLPVDVVEKIVSGEYQEWVAVPGFNAADQAAGEIRKASFPRENFTFNDYIDRDIQEAWAMGSNQQGLQTKKGQTATEASIQQSATQTRMKREQIQVARWFVAGVQKLGALLQLFADDPDYVEVVGEDGIRSLASWDKTKIQGRFAYSAKPDSTLQLDAAWDKKQAIDEYQMLRQDPLVNPQYLLTRLARRIGADPAQFLAQPQPPKPEPPKPAFSFKGEDLNPAAPQSPIVMEILAQGGVQISPQAMQQAQMLAQQQILVAQQQQAQAQADTTHKGAAPQTAPLSKHAADASGMLPGAGMAPAQGGAVQ